MNRYINRSHKNRGCSSEAEIVGVCGDFGYRTKQQVHDDIKQGKWTYWSTAPGVPDALVQARGEGPNRYIQTEADGKAKNNLVNLPDC